MSFSNEFKYSLTGKYLNFKLKYDIVISKNGNLLKGGWTHIS